MTVINKISIHNFRSHKDFSIKLSPEVTIITGNNGSGKTSILEAIYIALQGSSFRGSDIDILQYNTDWWRINIEFNSFIKRIIFYNTKVTTKKKQFNIEDKTIYRLTPKYKYPIVLFEPDDLRLLNGSPTRRRQFIDRLISQLDPLYNTSLYKYERALKQRNNLLKNPFISNDELFVWDVAISEYGSYIIEKRILFIEQINSKLNDVYNSIAKSDDYVSIHYSNTFIGNIKQKILNDLHINIEKDKIIGFTSSGPHRHDVIFKFNNLPALDIASRGEVRTIILALKFIEVEIIEQITNLKPIILLDDVFSELDESRQKLLINNRDSQIIITTTSINKKIMNDIDYKEINLS